LMMQGSERRCRACKKAQRYQIVILHYLETRPKAMYLLAIAF
jgi:hypothetical protein